jgi:pimeloyl-ACP methyl ester carboxylesterase
MNEAVCKLGSGVELCYRCYGAGEPLLLIAGLGLHLTSWPEDLVEGLVDRGFRVLAFDNRDVGRSTRFSTRPPTALQIALRRVGPAPYDLNDMAADAIGLLDALGIPAAHLVGMSMGGMIAQTIAARRPERVLSLTSIFSTTGALFVGQPSFGMMLQLMRAPAKTRDEAVAGYLEAMRRIGGVKHRINESRLAVYAREAWERGGGSGAAGVGRQIAAILKSGNRTASLKRITAPTLVIHGDRDRMVHPSGGKATAAAIKGARFVSIPGMGHDIADSVIPKLVELIAHHARNAK